MGIYSVEIKDQIPAESKFVKDDRFWTLPKVTSKDNPSKAIIRFIVDYANSKKPMIKLLKHNFKFNNYNHNEPCRKTINKECPICDLSNEYYSSGDPALVALGKSMYTKTAFISNILIVSDTNTKDNAADGKVFLLNFGTQIYRIISKAMAGDKEVMQDPVDIYDPYEGANFLIRKEFNGTTPEYINSKFLPQTKIKPTDEEIGAILSNTYNLDEFLAEDKFPSLEKVEAFVNVLRGNSSVKSIVEAEQVSVDEKTMNSNKASLDDILNN